LFFRPLPQGRQLFIILIQCICLFIVQGTNNLLFQTLLLKHFDKSLLKDMHSFFSFENIPLLLCLPMGFIADRYFGRTKVLYCSWILLFFAQLMFGIYFVIFSFITHKESELIAGVFVFTIGILINSLSLAGIRVNLISFGAEISFK